MSVAPSISPPASGSPTSAEHAGHGRSRLLPLPACILLAAGAVGAAAYGVVSYHENEAWMDFHTEPPRVWDAAMASLRENGYTPSGDSRLGINDSEIRAGDATVWVERHPGGVTRAKVRVGTFDSAENKRLAALVLEGMKKRLVK
jgi:hypothetical protein